MSNCTYYIGLISGTSVDGVDCALLQFEGDKIELIDTVFTPCPAELRDQILQLCSGSELSLELLGQVDVKLGRVFAGAVSELLRKTGMDAAAITAIGSHGQTVFHSPEGEGKGGAPFTLQIADPNIIAQLSGITTVADFRRRDMAAGGEGAPLAPLLHRQAFSSSEEDRVVVNIGGISNITVLKKNGDSLAFDTGPGNVLMDYWIEKHRGQKYDNNGDWAASGESSQELLEALLDESYFARAHPKSTGRELFNGPWLEAKLADYDELCAADVQATLLEFTAATIAQDIENLLAPRAVFVCGGGAHNKTLMESLGLQFEDCIVDTTSVLGIDPDWVEAIAFAWMAKQTIEGIALDTSAFTGASEAVILGGIYQA